MLSEVMNMNPHPLQINTKLKFKNQKNSCWVSVPEINILLIMSIVHLEPLITVLNKIKNISA